MEDECLAVENLCVGITDGEGCNLQEWRAKVNA